MVRDYQMVGELYKADKICKNLHTTHKQHTNITQTSHAQHS